MATGEIPRDDDTPTLRPRNRNKTDDEMDITPMIDMTFLLLVFFLVCSTFEMQSPVQLASAKHGKGVAERESVVLSVGTGGADDSPVFIGDSDDAEALPKDPESRSKLIASAIEQAKATGKEHVLIRADRRVAHRDVATVIKMASRVEGMQIHLAVHEGE